MKSVSTKNSNSAKLKMPPLVALIAGLVVVVCLVWGGVALYNSLNTKSTVNYAQEVAKPLEEDLVKAGAIKKCGSGDAGRGSDNTQPHYGVTFELPVGREQAIATINQIAEEQGYKLNHASLTNRGPVSVDDKYIDNWFYDTAQKPSPYTDLQSGKITLFFVVNNDGPTELSAISCGTAKAVKVNSGENTTAVNVQVSLPSFKR